MSHDDVTSETEATPTEDAPAGGASPDGEEASRRWSRWSPRRLTHHDEAEGETDESALHRLVQQWALLREERRAEPEPMNTGPSRVGRADVPWGLDLAAAWAWRLLLIAAAGYGLVWLLGYFAVVTVPLAVALLVSALASPLVNLMDRVGLPRGLSALAVVIGGLAIVGALLTFAGQQVAAGATDLADSTVRGLGEIRQWLREGPLNASDSQINDYLQTAQNMIRDRTQDGEMVTQVTEVGAALGHIVAGFFITLFATYFFLADGGRIWGWTVRLAPRAARERVDSSGRVAWLSLVQFVRATVLVAMVDAIGVMVVAALLDVPFVLAIGVVVFLGAFVPMVGATVAGAVAVLVALVDQGPLTALLMLGGVILVQQIEGHVLQPFLMGRWVRLHPLGVIVAIAAGVLAAGIVGALVAVPLAAAANAVVLHLADLTSPADTEAHGGAGSDPAVEPEAADGLDEPGVSEVDSE